VEADVHCGLGMGEYLAAQRARPWPVRFWHELRSESTEQDRLIRLIILERLVKSAVLVVLAISLLAFGRHGQLYQITQEVEDQFNLSAGHGAISTLLMRVLDAIGRYPHVTGLAIAALLYAALESTEGVGLAFRRRWAEYLTVIATAVLIPFEVYELQHRVTVFRVLALAFNVLIVVYLAWRKCLFVTV
jgi:uncharacterized membrane protein (DUF2068 family)